MEEYVEVPLKYGDMVVGTIRIDEYGRFSGTVNDPPLVKELIRFFSTNLARSMSLGTNFYKKGEKPVLNEISFDSADVHNFPTAEYPSVGGNRQVAGLIPNIEYVQEPATKGNNTFRKENSPLLQFDPVTKFDSLELNLMIKSDPYLGPPVIVDEDVKERRTAGSNISKAIAYVMTFFNSVANPNNNDPSKELSVDDPIVVWFAKVLQNWKALIFVPRFNLYYEVTCNGDNNVIYVDEYTKINHAALPYVD